MQLFEIIPYSTIYNDTVNEIINNEHNSRFNIQNILKHGEDNKNILYYVLKDTDIGYLAIAGISKNLLDVDIDNFSIVNFQSLYHGKGYGKKLLDKIIDIFKNVWLMADPSQKESLIEYYKNNPKLDEFILVNSIYNKPLHFYYSINFDRRISNNFYNYVKKIFGKQK